MEKITPEILSLLELIELHSPLSKYMDPNSCNISIKKYDFFNTPTKKLAKPSIYVLLRNDVPYYVGKSIDPLKRLQQHIKEKMFDEAIVIEVSDAVGKFNVLSYIEFLCFYYLWSCGYCLVYNSKNVWNSLPILNKEGPLYSKEAIGHAHAFAIQFANIIYDRKLKLPAVSAQAINVKLYQNKIPDVSCNALYWRPSIMEEQIEMAFLKWPEENPNRPQFAGLGAFFLLEGSRGKIWGNYTEQEMTYKILVKIGVLEESSIGTVCRKKHPFCNSNIMVGNILGGQSQTARYDLIINGTKLPIKSIEQQWRELLKLTLP